MNLSDFRTSVAAELGLDGTTGSEDVAHIERWINQAIRDVLLRTHCHVGCAHTPLTAGSSDYTLANAILAIIHLAGDGLGVLEYVSPEEIFERQRQSANGSGGSTAYTVLGSDRLILSPAPSGEGELTMYYVPKPLELTDDAEDPSDPQFGGIPSEFHRGIELRAFSYGGSYDDDESSKMGKSYEDQYEFFLTRVIRPAVNRKGSAHFFRARIGGRPTRPVANDVYPYLR